MQRVRFGLALDGQRGWHTRDALGEPIVGPLGMLNLLEVQLGLVRILPSLSERVVQMRECLQASRNGSRFYEASFIADELGTAATLLSWRDLWYEHGWTGNAPTNGCIRLTDMVEVERLAQSKVAPGLGQRLADIEAKLEERRPQVASITLLDSLEHFPLMWRRVLAKLPVDQLVTTTPSAEPGTFLRAVQDALVKAHAGMQPAPIPWRNDGSVRIVRGESRIASAQWLAQQICKSDHDHVVIAEQAGTMLDAALASHDQPRLGLTESSTFRPTLQLLPLAMRLLWEPLNFNALLQFLTHPVHPLRQFARRRIAEKMADAPGIGGNDWNELLSEIEAHFGADANQVMEEIRFWIEHERFMPQDKAPLANVFERVDRLATFFRNRLIDDDEARRAGWHIGRDQSAAVRQSVKNLIDQGIDRIAPETLDKLVAQATAMGSANPQLYAQAGAQACVTDPGALIEPFNDVFWWHLVAVPMPRPYTWSPSELRELNVAGVELPSMDTLLARQAQGWLQPILFARNRLTLVLPRVAEEVHPIWLLVSSVLDIPTIESVETVLTAEPRAGESSVVCHHPLPKLRRWWHLPAEATIHWPEAASYSSLEQLLYNPYQWVLSYPARLRSSALLNLPDDFRLLGNLAHRVVERLYRHEGSQQWTQSKVLAWFDAHLDTIIREEGAVLLMPGKRAELEAFRMRFRDSLSQLHKHICEANVTGIEPEKDLEGDTTLGKLKGSSDLLLTFGTGNQAVVDMKWAGQKKYREKLISQTHIQLGIYGKLQEQTVGRWPAVAYYILRQGELLTTSRDLFPGVRAIEAPEDAAAQLWQRIITTWNWRKGQIENGAIELVFEGLDPTEESDPPIDALPIEALDPRYNPFVHLAGWEQ
jgi:hypothetical protein